MKAGIRSYLVASMPTYGKSKRSGERGRREGAIDGKRAKGRDGVYRW